MHYGKCLISSFQDFFLALTKILISQGDWALGYHSMGFRHPPDFSNFPMSIFPKVLSYSVTFEATRIYHLYK